MIQRVKREEIGLLSKVATEIIREHFDPIIGSAQNDYMLERFQSVEAITKQFDEGYNYYWMIDEVIVGFLAFFEKEQKLYLSKFYVKKEHRNKHYATQMFEFVKEQAIQMHLPAIFLNVNKHNDDVISKYKHLGFEIVRMEKNDIGNGYYMDDYVLEYTIKER